MAIISAEQFRNRAISTIEIPGFDKGETFEIKVKKLSIVGLISSGKIPNSLMQVVKDAFTGIKSAGTEADESNVMDKAGEIGKLLDIICEESMLEPRFIDVRDVMNEEQKLAVFQFAQGGVEEVKPFPTIEGDIGPTDDVENISSQTE